MENYKLENAPMVVRSSDTRTPSKPPLKISTYQQSPGNRLHRRGAGEYEAKRISEAKQKRAQRKAELRHHQQSFLPQTSLVLSATGSLEVRLVSLAILEHTNNNTSHS